MKKLIGSLTAFLLFTSVGITQEQLSGKYTIKMDVSNLPDKPGKMFYNYYNPATRESFSDSVEIKDNDAKIKGELEEPVLMALRFVSSLELKNRKIKTGNMKLLYAEPGEINLVVRDSMSNAIVKGSASHLAYEQLTGLIKPFNEKQNILFKEYSILSAKKDSSGITKK
jgi:hypothetical protein